MADPKPSEDGTCLIRRDDPEGFIWSDESGSTVSLVRSPSGRVSVSAWAAAWMPAEAIGWLAERHQEQQEQQERDGS